MRAQKNKEENENSKERKLKMADSYYNTDTLW